MSILQETLVARNLPRVASKGPRVVYLVTHPITARILLEGQLAYLRERGFEVVLICSPGKDAEVVEERDGIQVVTVRMEREISAWWDWLSLAYLFRALVALRPDVVNASTPKAGLLGMIAAWAARVPVRIYNLRGLRLEGTRGIKRLMLSASERIATRAAHRIMCISQSLQRTYVAMGISPREKTTVLCHGSSNGIDSSRFARTPHRLEESRHLRAKLGIPPGAPVIGFVGRLVRDKGVVELLEAFELVLAMVPNCRLLLVGGFESGDPVSSACARRLREHPEVVMSGFVSETAAYYALMDVLAFPTHREGFGNAALEAAAAEVPVVGFRVTGVVDAVVDGVTGTLVQKGDVGALANALLTYLRDPQLRRCHGQAGRCRAVRDFRREAIWEALAQEYVMLLNQRCPEREWVW